jgi:hypothetical protein
MDMRQNLLAFKGERWKGYSMGVCRVSSGR